MSPGTLMEANELTDQIWRCEEALKRWEGQDMPMHPVDEYRPITPPSVATDRDTWAVYRRASIAKLLAHKAELEAKLKAL